MENYEPLFSDDELRNMYKDGDLVIIPGENSHYGSIRKLKNGVGKKINVARVFFDFGGQSKGQVFLTSDLRDRGVIIQGAKQETIDNLLPEINSQAVEVSKGVLYQSKEELIIKALEEINGFIMEKERVPSIGELR